MTDRRVMPFFCDKCGVELSTGNACPQCKRVLCHRHFFGSRTGIARRKDGLCAQCAEAKAKVSNGQA